LAVAAAGTRADKIRLTRLGECRVTDPVSDPAFDPGGDEGSRDYEDVEEVVRQLGGGPPGQAGDGQARDGRARDGQVRPIEEEQNVRCASGRCCRT
jgi:hypothetical protein